MEPQVYFVSLAVIAALAYLLVNRADKQRLDKESENKRLQDMLTSARQGNEAVIAADLEARNSLKKLTKFYKKKAKELQSHLDEIHMISQDGGEEASEDESEDEEEGHVPPRRPDKLASMLIAMQRKMRKAKDIVENAAVSGKPMDIHKLSSVLDTSLSALDEELGHRE